MSQEEISLTEVSYEPGSDAVKLAEFGDLKITNTGYELMEYGRTKILTTSGLDYAQRKWSLRPEKKFDTIEELSKQITEDCIAARAFHRAFDNEDTY